MWAPGRVNLIGEHTDHSGGLVMPMAIHLGLSLVIHRRRDDVVKLDSERFGDGEPFPPDGSGAVVRGWARTSQAVAGELAALGRPAVGMEATITSTLPAGVGLSSSAALEVATALALCAVADFPLPALELAAACQRAEARALGVPCGILDQAACLLGEHDASLLLNCTSLEHRHVPIPNGAAFLILDSGVERQLKDTGYAQRQGELKAALAAVGASNSLGLADEDLAHVDGVLRRRLRHVLTENSRVLAFASALTAGDLRAAGAILTESHISLRDDYEVSIPELDDLAESARRFGAYGSRLVGGGFGGAVLALVDRDSAADVRDAIGGLRPDAAPPVIVYASRGARVEGPAAAAPADAGSEGPAAAAPADAGSEGPAAAAPADAGAEGRTAAARTEPLIG